MIHPRRSRQHPKQAITDLDLADDISLLSDEIIQAQELLLRFERELMQESGTWNQCEEDERATPERRGPSSSAHA